jgi:hypothetical protein
MNSLLPRRAGEKVPKADEGGLTTTTSLTTPYGRNLKYSPYRAAS